MLREVLIGTVAGAAGTAVLNIVTNLDMVVRARPASGVPATVAGEMAARAGVDPLSIENEAEEAQNRQSGAGALLGYVTGIGIGAIYGCVRPHSRGIPTPVMGATLGLAAMVASDVPAATFNATDPKTWGANAWLSDLIPHMLYGFATAAVYETLTRRR